jgi:predicted component of type VI protein secretion system
MSTSSARPAAFKPLTLPRSLSRVLSRLLAMPPEDSLPLARDAHASATCPRQRIIAMRLRLRLLQEALQALQSPVVETPEPEPVIEIVPEPEPEPVEEPKAPAPKMGKLISMDLEGGALAMMMQGLGGSQGDDDDDDDFFSKD